MSAAMRETEWLAVGETAKRLRCSTEWVRQLAKAGELQSFTTPYGLLLDAASVEALAARRAEAPKDAMGRLLRRKATPQAV